MADVKQGYHAYKRLLGSLRPYRMKLVAATVCMAVVAGTNGATTYMIKPVIDRIFADHDGSALLMLSLAYPMIFLVKGTFAFLKGFWMADVGQSVIRDLRIDLFRHILNLDQRFFHQTSTGELVSRVTNDVRQVQIAVTMALTGLFQHVLSILVLVAVIIELDWQLALMALVVFPVAVIPMARFGRMVRNYARRGQASTGELSSQVVDSVKGVRVVQVFQMEERQVESFAVHANSVFRNLLRQARTRALSSPVTEVIAGLGAGVVIYVGGLRVIEGDMTQGTFMAFITSLLLVYDPVKKLSNLNADINQGVAAAERIFALMDTPTQIEDIGTEQAQDLQEAIAFDRVQFAYDPTKGSTLHDISFQVPRGQVVALVGPSGAGKSTLVDLVPRFLDPDAGCVRWDGTDIRQFSLSSLRQHIAMVDQQTVLFNGSLRENLLCAGKDVDDTRLQKALHDADLAAFVDDLPAGLDTLIGEDGVQLSGGQRQRLAIARALLNNAPVLVLDEATSSLDTASEQAVQQALEHLMVGRTTIVIAHRLSTIRNANKILVLQDGCIVQSGRFDELAETAGLFQKLVQQQSLSAS